MSQPTAAPPPRVLTVADAAEHLGTTTSKLYELVARHAIPSVRIGRAIRISEEALDRLASTPDQSESEAPANELDRLASDAGEPESEMRPSDSARTNRLLTGPARISPSPTAPQISEAAARHIGDRPPPSSRCPSAASANSSQRTPSAELRETPSPATALHPRATRPRVDAESRRGARS